MLDVSARSTQHGPLALAVRGTAERPQAVLRAESPGLGVGLRNLVARVEGEATGYHVDAAGDTAYGPLLADVLIRTGREPLSIDVRRARFAGVDRKSVGYGTGVDVLVYMAGWRYLLKKNQDTSLS